eukprot:TRINITY_DN44976_c0_g1_i1.p1 TRINITY_DN44976_c0_g1~~TRINITY_DN44976_c0_g1_i1.p1  ORF type:complete len:245 (+),score=15.59 TRINITY_DN44976_c0_g1_i1:274-1008(+)
MSALVRITTGIMPQHSRVGMTRAMTQFGEVIHCHKPPYSGIPGEDFVNVRFATQEAADRAYAALKQCQVFVDGFQVGVGPTPGAKPGGADAFALENGRRRSPSPPRRYGRNRQRSPLNSRHTEYRELRAPVKGNFPSRNDPKSPSPRRLAREMNLSIRDRGPSSRSRSRGRDRRRDDRADGFGGHAMRAKSPTRSPSPDPPGPVKNTNPVKNPFYKPHRSPSRSVSLEPERRSRGYYHQGYDLA